MTRAPAVGEDLVGALRSSLRAAPAGALVTVTVELGPRDAAGLFLAARATGTNAVAWLRPDDGVARVAAGEALAFAARGPGRIHALRRRWAELRSSIVGAPGLRAFTAFSFDERPDRADGPRWDDFPSALLVVPRLLVEWRDGRVIARATAVASGDGGALDDVARMCAQLEAEHAPQEESPVAIERTAELPSPERWREDVARAREEIERELFQKIVLARTVRVHLASAVAEGALSTLARRFPACTVYAIGRGDSCLVGATPESLVSLADGAAQVSCVAGTAPRSADAGEDAARAQALARSGKERAEHDLVVSAARTTLEGFCDVVTESDMPRLIGLANVWHLASDVGGRVRAGVELLDLAAALHPTPAVCGVPRQAALRSLAQREPFDRGWYGGVLGWVDERGDGDLAVALRCALARPGDAWLFAGCGIVAGSDPEAELAESEAKLRPMLEALGAS